MRPFLLIWAIVAVFLLLCLPGEAQDTNLALGKPTWQSSVTTGWPWAVAGLAVDGNSNPRFHHGKSCTHTGGDSQSWWAVDLGDGYHVSRVIITNRGDCCGDRLRDFNIGLTSSPPNETPPTPDGYDVLYHQTEAVEQGETVTFDIDDSPSGRYLVIQLLYSSPILTLCEVEVYEITCRATGPWEGDPYMDDWCEHHCPLGNCPPTHCICD